MCYHIRGCCCCCCTLQWLSTSLPLTSRRISVWSLNREGQNERGGEASFLFLSLALSSLHTKLHPQGSTGSGHNSKSLRCANRVYRWSRWNVRPSNPSLPTLNELPLPPSRPLSIARYYTSLAHIHPGSHVTLAIFSLAISSSQLSTSNHPSKILIKKPKT